MSPEEIEEGLLRLQSEIGTCTGIELYKGLSGLTRQFKEKMFPLYFVC